MPVIATLQTDCTSRHGHGYSKEMKNPAPGMITQENINQYSLYLCKFISWQKGLPGFYMGQIGSFVLPSVQNRERKTTRTIFPHTKQTNKRWKMRERNIRPLTPKCFLRLCVKLKKVEKRENKAHSKRRKLLKIVFSHSSKVYESKSRCTGVSVWWSLFSVTSTRKEQSIKYKIDFFIPCKNCMASIVGCASVSDQGKNVLTTYITQF